MVCIMRDSRLDILPRLLTKVLVPVIVPPEALVKIPAGLASILDTAFGDLEWGKRLKIAIHWSQSATLSGERDRLSFTRAT